MLSARWVRVSVAVVLVSLCGGVVIAQTYPTKPIRMVMPFPPGGPTDVVGRLVAQKLSEQIGQSVVADSRPGASGNVGLEIASKAPADGYTIVLSSPVIALSPLLYGKLNFDPWKDLAPIALVGAIRNVLVVHPSVPANNLKELIAIARKQPGSLSYGSGGIGTTTHLAPELFKSLEKLDILHVPYKGSGLALIGLASGQVDMEVVAASVALSQVQSKRVRAIAVLSPERLADYPGVATTKEQGYANFEISVWYGMLAPAGTPRDIINRLNAELVKAVHAPDMKARYAQAGVEPLSSTPDEFGRFIQSEAARFGKVIKEAGIKGE
jgi:tripartite-type tricarboxylate transporter receptor subunit TctC